MQVRYGLNNVVKGTEQTLKHKETGKSFTVNGDGRLDAFLMNDSHSAAAIQSIEDRRIQALAREIFPVVLERGLSGEESFNKSIAKNLGPNWSPCSIHRYTVSTSMTEGDLTLGLTFSNYSDRSEAITLWASKVDGDSKVTQSVYKDQENPTPVESLTWVPSVKAAEAELASINAGLAQWSKDIT
jgi:hypothetical protein